MRWSPFPDVPALPSPALPLISLVRARRHSCPLQRRRCSARFSPRYYLVDLVASANLAHPSPLTFITDSNCVDGGQAVCSYIANDLYEALSDLHSAGSVPLTQAACPIVKGRPARQQPSPHPISTDNQHVSRPRSAARDLH